MLVFVLEGGEIIQPLPRWWSPSLGVYFGGTSTLDEAVSIAFRTRAILTGTILVYIRWPLVVVSSKT